MSRTYRKGSWRLRYHRRKINHTGSYWVKGKFRVGLAGLEYDPWPMPEPLTRAYLLRDGCGKPPGYDWYDDTTEYRTTKRDLSDLD